MEAPSVEEQIQASLDQDSDVENEQSAVHFQDAQSHPSHDKSDAKPAKHDDHDELAEFHDAENAPPLERMGSSSPDDPRTSKRATTRPSDEEKEPHYDEDEDDDDHDREKRRQDEKETRERLRHEAEAALSPTQREERHTKALELKQSGNAAYLASQNVEAVALYSEALEVCPLSFPDDRAILFANRAAAQFKKGDLVATIQDCSESLELKPDYLKALVRRAQAYEDQDKPHEALKDFEKVLELDPKHAQANVAVRVRLPEKVKAKDEQIKAEMMANLKKLGNMVLNPFGLSTENFQFVQDPESGNYSVNFSQNNKS